MDLFLIQKYVNNFRRVLSKSLKPNLAVQIKIYNCGADGAILEIFIKPEGMSIDEMERNYPSISDALSEIKHNFISGDLHAARFTGTNIDLSSNRILLIKDSNPVEWGESKLREDLSSIFNPPTTTSTTTQRRK